MELDPAVAQLERLGITRNEARVYLALLRSPRSTAAELAEIAQVPRPKVYAALQGLERRGFAAGLGGRVARYRATSPNRALRSWIGHRDHERELAGEADHRVADELSRLLEEQEQPARTSEGVGYIEAVSGHGRVSEMSEALILDSQERVLMLQQPPYFQAPSRWNRAEFEALGRGVSVRVMYSPEAVADERRFRGLAEAGAELRVLSGTSIKLIVRDGAEALVALRDPVTGEDGMTSAVIRHPELVAALELLFEKEWQKASPLAPERAEGP